MSGFTRDAQASMARHVEAMVGFQDAGAEVFDCSNSIRDEHGRVGSPRLRLPGVRTGLHPAAVRGGKGPFRWAALSGDPGDIARTDAAILELFPEDTHLRRWITMAGERVAWQGLPARICWLGYERERERARAGLRFNELVAAGEIGPIVIGRDHLDSGRSRVPTARRRGCGTGATPSPTGRC